MPRGCASFARPKSSILTCPRSVTKMFADLMSRCTMPQRVRGVERVGDLHAEVEQGVHRQRPVRQPALQRRPVEQLHDQERQVAVMADVVERADVRMVERRGGARLALEALERRGILRELGREELDGDLAAETRVLGAVDDTHPAFADLVEDAVVGDGLADHFQINKRS